MNPRRFSPEEAAKIRNQYFFERKPDGKRFSYTDLSRLHKTCISTIIDVVNQRRIYKPSPEVLKSRLATASEAMRMFIGEVPRLPRKHEETYATTMIKGEMLRIRKSPVCGGDGRNLYVVETVRRQDEQARLRDQSDRQVLLQPVQGDGDLPDTRGQEIAGNPVQNGRAARKKQEQGD